VTGHQIESFTERRATIRDVAALAAVSHQTVSRVINGQTSVAEPTRRRVLEAIEQFEIPNVEILPTPLRDFDGFSWYDAPLAALPERFELVICDGPPGETLGGRYGLMPVVGDRLPVGAVVLLDDTERAGELAVLQRWLSEASFDVTMHESDNGSFAVLTRVPRGRPEASIEHRLKSMPPAPLVSIIIPAYNVAPFIAETLESVFAQTYPNYEVIVINDGSPDTDDFDLALAPYLDRLSYLQQENLGASVARNAGLRAARGEFVAFLDADDVWLPNYLADQMTFIRERGCDLVCADAEFFGDPKSSSQSYMTLLMDSAPETSDVSFRELVLAERSLITSGVVARREPIIEVGLFDEALRNAQDFDLWLRLAHHGARVSYQRRVLLKYRCRANGLTGDAVNCHTRELRVLDKVEQAYDLAKEGRDELLPLIHRRRAELEFELGKAYLEKAEFAKAIESFRRANTLWKTWKTGVALWLSRVSPKLIQVIFARRMEAR